MFHILALPFTLIGVVVKAIWALIMLPVHLLLVALHMAFGLVAFAFQVGVWVACMILAVTIAKNRGLNPTLCLILGAFGPIGLLIVLAMAMTRPARAY